MRHTTDSINEPYGIIHQSHMSSQSVVRLNNQMQMNKRPKIQDKNIKLIKHIARIKQLNMISKLRSQSQQ